MGAGGVVAGEGSLGRGWQRHRATVCDGPAVRGLRRYCPARRLEVAERVRRRRTVELTAAERRVAEVVLARPQLVGFGTVADLADAANAGAASVVRLAGKLGFDGYSDLQASDPTRPHAPAATGRRADPRAVWRQPIVRHRAAELANVQATLDAVDPGRSMPS